MLLILSYIQKSNYQYEANANLVMVATLLTADTDIFIYLDSTGVFDCVIITNDNISWYNI